MVCSVPFEYESKIKGVNPLDSLGTQVEKSWGDSGGGRLR